jgi:hypothetical protein
MAENKTQPTDAPVEAYLAAIADDTRRHDCEALVRMMSRVTGQPPVMWGDSIVGFDRYHYRYDSGREGDAAQVGFSSRKTDISVYLCPGAPGQDALLARLGRHKMGVSCLSLRRLDDVDREVLEQLVVDSVAAVRARYPG